MKNFHTKKGVSPLIATVLLIGFTVAIVSLVVMWGKGYTEEKAEKQGALSEAQLSCENIDFTVTAASWNGGRLILQIKNRAATSIDAFVFRINQGAVVIETADVVRGMSTEELEIYDATMTMDEISSVEVIPKKKVVEGTYVPCSSKSKNVINVQNPST